MTGKFEVRVGKSLQEAWELFLRAPEIFALVTLAYLVGFFILSKIPVVGNLVLLLAASLIAPAFFLVAESVRTGEKASFGVLASLVPIAPQLVLVFILKTILITLGFFLFVIPGIYLLVVFAFAELFVVLYKKTFWESMDASKKLVKQNWFGVFGLTIFVMLLAISGLMVVGVGLLATAPLAALVLYSSFRNIISQVTVS